MFSCSGRRGKGSEIRALLSPARLGRLTAFGGRLITDRTKRKKKRELAGSVSFRSLLEEIFFPFLFLPSRNHGGRVFKRTNQSRTANNTRSTIFLASRPCLLDQPRVNFTRGAFLSSPLSADSFFRQELLSWGKICHRPRIFIVDNCRCKEDSLRQEV